MQQNINIHKTVDRSEHTEGLTKKIRELSEKLGIDPDVLLRGGPLSNKLSTRSIA